MHAGVDFVPKWVMAASSSRGGGVTLPQPAVLDGTSNAVLRWEEGNHKRPHPNHAERRGATSNSLPLTGASSGAPSNPPRGWRRRLHGTAS